MSAQGTILRNSKPDVCTMAVGQTVSGTINAGSFNRIAFAGNLTAGTVTYQTGNYSAGTFRTAKDNAGVAITTTLSGDGAYAIPADVSVWPYVKIVGNIAQITADSVLSIIRVS